jgi:hypothetical protein
MAAKPHCASLVLGGFFETAAGKLAITMAE